MPFDRFHRPGLARPLASALVLACALSTGAARADSVIFDSLTDAHIGDPLTVGEWEFPRSAADSRFFERGDVIQFAGSDRRLQSVRLGLAYYDLYINDSSVSFAVSLSIWDAALTHRLATQTLTIRDPRMFDEHGRATYRLEIAYDFSAQSVVLPDTIYYGVQVNDRAGTMDIALGMRDYFGLGDSLLVGADPGTVLIGDTGGTYLYGRTHDSPRTLTALHLQDFPQTPAVQFTAAPVPEPASAATLLAGLAGLVTCLSRRGGPR